MSYNFGEIIKKLYSLFQEAKPRTYSCDLLTLSPTALGPIGPRVFKGIQLKA